MQIYLDYSATTPPRPEAIAAVTNTMQQQWGNPSSLHEWGRRSATVLERARMQVADLVGADPGAIVFTSGGTEANHLAVFGVARRCTAPGHAIASRVEHPAVSEPMARLQRQGWDVTWLEVDGNGRVDPADLAASLRPDTALVSIIYGQSEVGTLQPIAELGRMARDRGVLFHTDAVQVAGRLPIDVSTLPVDLLSLSSHKLYGPQGAGALYVRPGVELAPWLRGGNQEFALRSGTQAVPTLAGFGAAAALAAVEVETEMQRLQNLRDRLFDRLSDCPYLQPVGDRWHRLPHHVSFCLQDLPENVTGKAIVRQCDLAGLAISSGSACHSGKTAPSAVLSAMGYSPQQAKNGIRLTLGRHTTAVDVDWTAMVLKQILVRSRLVGKSDIRLASV